MRTLIALGPGEPSLVPLASWRALETAGPVHTPDGEPFWGSDRLEQIDKWLATGGW